MSTPCLAPLALLALAVPAAAQSPTGEPVRALVRLLGPRAVTAATLLDLDVAERGGAGAAAWVDVLATDEERRALARLGVDAEVRVADLAAFYARRLQDQPSVDAPGTGAWLAPPFAQGSMGGYYTWPELESVLDQLQAAYPQLVAPKVSIGATLEGRPTWMVKLSDNPLVDEPEPEVRIDAMHHAREPQGMQTAVHFMCWLLEGYGTDPLATYLLEERELYFVPCANPDGYEYNRLTNPGGGGLWRKNRRDNGDGTFGVDLNRNYAYQWGYSSNGSSDVTNSQTYRGPGPASEPETQNMQAFFAQRGFATALSIHTYSNLWMWAYGYENVLPANDADHREVAADATAQSGYAIGPIWSTIYPANGNTVDYDHAVHGTLSWTPEIGSSTDGFWPAQSRIVPLAEENLRGLQATALAAGTWLRPTGVQLADLGDGDGAFEPGEEVGLTLLARNSGLGAAGGAAYTVTSSSPHVAVLSGAASGPAGPFSDVPQLGTLRLRLAPTAPYGAAVPFTVVVQLGAYRAELASELYVGDIALVAAWDFEAATNEGWGLGASTATTGLWERVDPVGTAAQPEDDHTPSGTQCWVTGQGAPGGALGANDVDGGATALVSARFDATVVARPTLAYWRWYSNSTGGAAGQDVLEVDVSTDDGATWQPLEVVGPSGPGTTGGWEYAEHDLTPFGPTTAMRVRFTASDYGTGSIVEAAVDDVELLGYPACPPPVRYCQGQPNAWGPGAAIGWSGSTSVAANDLVLSVSGANPSGFGLFFRGTEAPTAPTPLGNGLLCLAGNLYRFPVVTTDPAGAAGYALDVNAYVPWILAGETWTFQYWYRDVGAAGYNGSDALAVTFCD